MEDIMKQLTGFATAYGLKVIGAILMLIIGRIVAGAMRKGMRRIMIAVSVADWIACSTTR